MDLIIDDNEVYKIKVGIEVYSVDYPSLEQARIILKESANLVKDEEAEDFIKKWLITLGLDKKFFKLKSVKKRHLIQVWSEINAVKK